MADKSPSLIRPDYNTDVLWKTPHSINRMHTMSTDSVDSDSASTGRRFSLSEYFTNSLFNRRGSVDSAVDVPTLQPKKHSIIESADFKELLQRQKRILEE